MEIPQGGRNKYELDHQTGRLRLDRQLFTATCYPTEYGFLDGTLGLDGDPLDALVLTEAPTFPGCLIDARPIGVFVMADEHGSDNKMLTVPRGDPRYDHLRDIDDLAGHIRAEIAHFFEVYKQLEPGKPVTGTRWADREQARLEIDESIERYRQQHARGHKVAPR
ncbi:inorganic diphosphatase [Actinomycetospora endophytica]|uniref:inorganic diphosphatase n=1 Tax=Actinomycetospora endophytica TaxID=2291215 RepID=UPI0027E342E6|nr:inorganic diphosphatase [Actinomycetospora endophytica]